MKIMITGSIAIDYLMTFPGRFTEHILPDKLDTISLSFLVTDMAIRRGGVAPNIAYTMALLGEQAKVFATVGEDFSDYGAWLRENGVNTALIRKVPGVNTAAFFANTDLDNNQIASFYPGAMGHAAELSFHDLQGAKPDLAVISPNDPAAMVKYVQECVELGIPYLYDPSQQLVRMDGADIRAGVEGAHALFVNEYEFSLIEKHTGLSLEEIRSKVNLLVITLAEKGARVYAGDQTYEVEAYPPERIVDPTGVGDAFRGGFLAGLSKGFSSALCAKIGSLAATYVLEQQGTMDHSYTPAEFVARFRKVFDDQGALDSLISE